MGMGGEKKFFFENRFGGFLQNTKMASEPRRMLPPVPLTSDQLAAMLETKIDGALALAGVPTSATLGDGQPRARWEIETHTDIKGSSSSSVVVRCSEFEVDARYAIRIEYPPITEDKLAELCVKNVVLFLGNQVRTIMFPRAIATILCLIKAVDLPPPIANLVGKFVSKQYSTSRSEVRVLRPGMLDGVFFGIGFVLPELPPACYHCSRRHCELLRGLENGEPACCRCFHATDPCPVCVHSPVLCAGCDASPEAWAEVEGEGNLCANCYF